MKSSMRRVARWLAGGTAVTLSLARAGAADLRDEVAQQLAAGYPALAAIYEDLHRHPELSFMEVNTAALVARELRAVGCEVTEKVGNTGVVGVLRNGPGPTVLFRADMDALPIQEKTGLPYASTAVVKDLSGRDQPAMHACAHDMHVTNLIGSARILAALKAHWSGTVLFVAQPAEEIVAGARAMLSDGLYTRFPKPDCGLALHVWAQTPAGVVGYADGAVLANVSSIDILVRGVSGHGSAPHTAKDPVVLAAEIVTALQTIVSREVKPGATAVVTVGAIHGGTKRNIIPDEVKLELTLRSFDEAVMTQMVAAVRRICAGLGQAAGLPEDRLPVVTLTPESSPAMLNDAALTRRVAAAQAAWLGTANVQPWSPSTGAEDFTLFGRTAEKVPVMMWFVGATAPAKIADSQRTGVPLPSNHNFAFAPVVEPTLKACVTSTTAAVLDLLAKK